MGIINFDDGGYKTDDIKECANNGCGFNSNSDCTASGTECFGYISAEKEEYFKITQDRISAT